jgi:hypothetical protein
VNKKFLLLATSMFIVFLAPGLATARPDGPDVSPLSNRDVLLMVESKMPTETIVKTIERSACTFDTFPPVLRELKRRGVPEEVLVAMIEAPYGPSLGNSSADDLGEQQIYHYTEQIKQYLTPVASTFRSQTSRSVRMRGIRTRNTN